MSEEPGAESFYRIYRPPIRMAFPAFLLTVGMVAADTLSPLAGRSSPQSGGALWANYDPDVEPLEVEVIREFEEEGVTIRMLVYTIGSLKRIPASVKNMP